jgi:hypothetical protein
MLWESIALVMKSSVSARRYCDAVVWWLKHEALLNTVFSHTLTKSYPVSLAVQKRSCTWYKLPTKLSSHSTHKGNLSHSPTQVILPSFSCCAHDTHRLPSCGVILNRGGGKLHHSPSQPYLSHVPPCAHYL